MIRPPRSVLVVVTRRIGDVLFATPLIRSLKAAWPGVAVDALVFESTAGVLAGNPDVRRIRAVPDRPGLLQHIAFIVGFARRYDMALSLMPGDRPTLYAYLGGRWRAGLAIDDARHRWKQWLLQRWVPFDDFNTHTLRMHLALAEALGIPPRAAVDVAWSDAHQRELAAVCPFDTARTAYAVLHVYPKFNYKMWHCRGWAELARWIAGRGMRIVLTGGGEAAEREYVNGVANSLPDDAVNLAGRLSLGAACFLVSRSRLYTGPDTGMTHVAAALGVPTVALFGPSNPVKWGPWPRGHDPAVNPWRRCGTQRRGNVVLLQGIGACVPCHLEGCDRRIGSYSDCLQQIPAGRVVAAAESLLD